MRISSAASTGKKLMEDERIESDNGSLLERNLRRNGLLLPDERVLAVLEQDASRGVVLTESRLFSFAESQIARQVVFEEVVSAECKARLHRTARYEFQSADGSTTSILLNGTPENVAAFCRALDDVCSSLLPAFVSKQPPQDKPAPRRARAPSPRPEAAPRSSERRREPVIGPAPTYGQSSALASYPNAYSIAAILLALLGLLPGYGAAFSIAAVITLAYARMRERGRESEWEAPLRALSLILCVVGLGSFFLYRVALGFPGSLKYAALAYSPRLPQALAASWVGQAVVAVVLLLFSVSFHEAAHALIAYWNGDSTSAKMGRITLNPIAHVDLFGSILLPILLLWSSKGAFFFAYARPVPVNPNRYRNLRLGYITVSFAGPGTNLLLALLAIWLQFFLACLLVVVHGVWGVALALHPAVGTAFFLLRFLVLVNIFLACFNLLPIPPLDGYHIIQGSLPWKWTEVLRPLERYGFFILLILLMSGALAGFFDVVAYFSGWAGAFEGLLSSGSPVG